VKKTALLGFSVGVVLGCLFGALVGIFPGGGESTGEPEMLSVNQSTGKPQLHIKGKPEIK
jgi:purine-cytosine permease-like protein